MLRGSKHAKKEHRLSPNFGMPLDTTCMYDPPTILQNGGVAGNSVCTKREREREREREKESTVRIQNLKIKPKHEPRRDFAGTKTEPKDDTPKSARCGYIGITYGDKEHSTEQQQERERERETQLEKRPILRSRSRRTTTAHDNHDCSTSRVE